MNVKKVKNLFISLTLRFSRNYKIKLNKIVPLSFTSDHLSGYILARMF